MTISPLMVELFPQLIRWTCNSSKLNSRTFLLGGRLGRHSPGPECVRSRSSVKGETWKSKSTFNISFQIHFVCFVLNIFIVSWILLIVAFNLLTPWCSFLQKGRLMKLCDGDCTIKKEIGNNVSFSSIFLEANIKIVYITRGNHVRSWTRSHCSAFPLLQHTIMNTLFASLYYASCTTYAVKHGIKCGNETMDAYLTFYQTHGDNWQCQYKGGKDIHEEPRALCQPVKVLMFNILPRQYKESLRAINSHLMWLNQGDSSQNKQYPPLPRS